MADYTKFFRAIWRDRDFLALPQSAKATYQMLATQPNINSAGVLTLAVQRWATYSPDTTPETINRDLDILEATRFVVIDRSTDELMVRTLIVHDGLVNQRNGPRSIEIAMSEVLSDKLANCIVEVAARVGLTLTPRVKQDEPTPKNEGNSAVEPLPVPIPGPVPGPLCAADKSARDARDALHALTFEEFYNRYPHKKSKGSAGTAYLKALRIAPHEDIMAGLERNMGDLVEAKSRNYCPYPASWLNAQAWNDEPSGVTRRPDTTAGNRASARQRLAQLAAQDEHPAFGELGVAQ